MSEVLSAAERGDMAEALLPEAAGLVVDVHDGSPEDVRSRLAGFSRHELEGLAVVLAALVDPDRGVAEALAWVDFDERGEPVARWERSRSEKTVAGCVPAVRRQLAGVDLVAVNRALSVGGRSVPLTQEERRLAVKVGMQRGLTRQQIAERLVMTPKSVDRAWERCKARERAAGREVVRVAAAS